MLVMANRTDLKDTLKGKLEEKELKLTKDNIALIVDAYEEVIVELLQRDGKISLKEFGNWEVRERAARKGRNPATGEEIEIKASKSPAFKPAKSLKSKF
jgi:DNA-binding protein HU-beta